MEKPVPPFVCRQPNSTGVIHVHHIRSEEAGLDLLVATGAPEGGETARQPLASWADPLAIDTRESEAPLGSIPVHGKATRKEVR